MYPPLVGRALRHLTIWGLGAGGLHLNSHVQGVRLNHAIFASEEVVLS
jgi:hypothetical protein